MRIFKTKLFGKWACKESITDTVLINAIDEMEKGLIDADLGSYVYKKRILCQAEENEEVLELY